MIGLIEFERVPYKGFSNLIWKSVMSGMVNTVSPFGKQKKESQAVKLLRKEHNKQVKKAERAAKKNKND